jgi:hypothetical protein
MALALFGASSLLSKAQIVGSSLRECDLIIGGCPRHLAPPKGKDRFGATPVIENSEPNFRNGSIPIQMAIGQEDAKKATCIAAGDLCS